MQECERSFWDNFSSWEEAERAWDEGAKRCQEAVSLKTGSSVVGAPYVDPQLSDVSMRLKGLVWVMRKDKGGVLFRNILKNPIKHFLRYAWSLLGKGSYSRDGDFFLFNTKSFEKFSDAFDPQHSVLIVGFSYCQKPFECQFGRFSGQCSADPNSPVCRQCTIGKAMNALPRSENTIPVIIPTVNDVGGIVLETIKKHKNKRVLFLITSCHMALSMFADLGYMVNISGVGFRLQGRFCNTFKAFQLSEQGIKPGHTVLSYEASKGLFELLKIWRLKTRAS